MGVPPFLILDGYKDRDRLGRDFTKPDSYQKEKTEPYQYFIPAWRGYLYMPRQIQQSNCAFFEAQFYTCIEAFGTKLGYIYCDLEHRDLGECITNTKKLSRYQAMKDIRFQQWLRGDRKYKYEPINQYVESVAASACGQNVYLMEKQRKGEGPLPVPSYSRWLFDLIKNML